MGECGSRESCCSSNEKGNCGSNCQCCCSKQEQGSCQEKSCREECEKEDFASCLIEAADCAWMEALKEKMKQHLLATQGDKLNELAKIVTETNNLRWKNKMEKKQGCKDFKEKLCNFFGRSKS